MPPTKPQATEVVKAIQDLRRKYMRETRRLDEDHYPLSHNYNQGAAYALKQAIRIIAEHSPSAPQRPRAGKRAKE